MQQESLYLEDGIHQLHLRHIHNNNQGTPVLMLHGVIENGKIFYTQSGKGLGCFLAEHGFDVYIADFRGKGLSTPNLKENAKHGQHEVITRDIPLFVDYIKQRNQQKIHVICHSWGGVLFSSYLARYPENTAAIASNICFGTKRTIYQRKISRLLAIHVLWDGIAPLLAKRKGYINAIKLKAGSDNESLLFLKQCMHWVKKNRWHDTEDGFDYYHAAKQLNWPDTWHITGIQDKLLGYIDDVSQFIAESNTEAKLSLLSKGSGNLFDYGHIDILTHPLARKDHFPLVVDWLLKRESKSANLKQ